MSTNVHGGAPTDEPRKPWLAALLAFFLGPFGLLYTGLLSALVAFGISLLLLRTIRAQPLVGIGLATIYALFAYLSTSRPHPRSSRLAGFDRPTWPKALLTLTAMLGIFFAFTTFVQMYVRWNGTSMAPTVSAGQTVTVKVHPAIRGPIERGTLVLYRVPEQKWRLIGRVVGLGGDQVTLKRGLVYVNGKMADNPVRIAALRAAGCLNAGLESNNTASLGVTDGPGTTVQVPKDQFFVIADNRADNYEDSRVLGSLPIGNVLGVIRPPRHNPAALTSEECQPLQPF